LAIDICLQRYKKLGCQSELLLRFAQNF